MSRLIVVVALLLGIPAVAEPAAPAMAPVSPLVIEMTVTGAGFQPATVNVKKGVPVKLVITRKTNATCAKEIVIKDYDVNAKLPLNTPVEVSFTPSKTGEVTYACGMDMVRGVLVVE